MHVRHRHITHDVTALMDDVTSKNCLETQNCLETATEP